MANALRKIEQHSAKMKKANHAIAHLFISDPYGKKSKMSFMHKIFLTHPPVEQRISALLNEENYN